MRITSRLGYEGGTSLQDAYLELTFHWSAEEKKTVPLTVRNAIEAAVILGHRFFHDDLEYGFPRDGAERPTVIQGVACDLPDRPSIAEPLRAFWTELVGYVSSRSMAPCHHDIDRTDHKRPFLAQMMLLDGLLHENPYFRTPEGMPEWQNFWTRREDFTRKDFLDEVRRLRDRA